MLLVSAGADAGVCAACLHAGADIGVLVPITFKVIVMQIERVSTQSPAASAEHVCGLQPGHLWMLTVNRVLSLMCAFRRTRLWPARWAFSSWTSSISLRCTPSFLLELALILKSSFGLFAPYWYMHVATKELADEM
jgi:hypothetical protein